MINRLRRHLLKTFSMDLNQSCIKLLISFWNEQNNDKEAMNALHVIQDKIITSLILEVCYGIVNTARDQMLSWLP